MLLAGCTPSQPPETGAAPKPQKAKADHKQLLRAIGNIHSYLIDLDGKLRLSNAQTWSQDAPAAQYALGNIRLELGLLKAGPVNAAKLDSLLSDLEGRLKGASLDNWHENASAARHIVGNIQIELQTLRYRIDGPHH